MKNLLLIGCGNMGSALLARWSNSRLGHVSEFMVVDPTPIHTSKIISQVKQLSELPKNYSPSIIVLAVKPNQLDEVLPTLKKQFGATTTYLSIAAGKTLSYYEHHLGAKASIVRAMPNTPAMIGEGMTALVGNNALTYEGRTTANELMEAVGEAIWLDDEKLMDVVTAISGSGPAYFFSFMAHMVEAAVAHGLSPQTAETLVKQTALGASALALDSDKGLCDLIKNVTSKGGTTEAALGAFNHNDSFNKLVVEAVQAAINKAKSMH